jgi:hypothetical protein
MTTLRQPNNIVTCKCCNAVLQFDWNEVFNGGGCAGNHYIKKYKAITCPCCKSKIKVWEEENTL